MSLRICPVIGQVRTPQQQETNSFMTETWTGSDSLMVSFWMTALPAGSLCARMFLPWSVSAGSVCEGVSTLSSMCRNHVSSYNLGSLWVAVVVAEVTQPSLGVGYELGRAVDMKKKILCLFRPSSGRSEHTSLIFFDLLINSPVNPQFCDPVGTELSPNVNVSLLLHSIWLYQILKHSDL